jgi:hypothetical protein
MKNTLLAILLLSASVTHADWRNPEAPFDATKNDTVTKQLSWHISKDIQKTCEQEHVKRGFAKPTWRLDACSFWKGNTCDIFTKPNPTMHDIGHELRHCYQGNYH